MTPELKTACEVIFQEHKVHPIKWNKDSFRGKISIGISQMAREILVKKHIILLPNKSKKVLTHLNPEVAAADSFEEAEKMIGTTEPPSDITHNIKSVVPEQTVVSLPKFISHPSQGEPSADYTSGPVATPKKWWLKPVCLYIIWPLCGVAAGALLSFLLNFIYTALFLHNK